MYITTQDALEAFVQRALECKVLAIDTEFLREKTYYAKLCLIQMSADDEVVIIDPLSIRNLKPLVPLLTSPNIMKLVHAGSQDLEILYHETGVLPYPLFDTQVAATLLGHVQQIGYAALVQAECGVSLKKIDSFSDWSRRPLTESQIDYAADDVVYLPRIYRNMRKRLEESGRLSWLDDDFKEMVKPENYVSDNRERFRRLKRVGSLTRKQLAAAREVAAWREEQAQKRNTPRKWVMTDEQIVEGCKREARTIDELFMVRGMREKLPTRDARTVVKLMVEAMDAPESAWPVSAKSGKSEPNVDTQVDMMMALARVRSRENNVALQTLAPHDELARLARGYTDDVELLKGWRRALVGNDLLDLLAGRITLSLDGGTLVVTKRDC